MTACTGTLVIPVSSPLPPSQAEQAAQEALAAFGGADLGSVSMKKRDLRSELQSEIQSRADAGELPRLLIA